MCGLLKLLLYKTQRKIRLWREYLSLRFLGSEFSDKEFINSLTHGTYEPYWRLPKILPWDLKRDPIGKSDLMSLEVQKLILDEAENICAHKFTLLGSELTNLGESINWHKDFKSGFQFPPKQFYAWIYPAKFPGGYDIKVPWELSRCQHFIRLGQAYWVTKDEKYTQEYTIQVLDWIEQNPPKLGVNWTSAMDVAIRAVNWIFSFQFFRDSELITNDFLWNYYKSLLIHGRHVFENLEGGRFRSSANNHYIANLVGLVWMGFALPFIEESSTWIELALPELWKEILDQTNEDGMSFEASIPYHKFVTEMLLKTFFLCRHHRVMIPTEVTRRLEKMLTFLHAVTRPDGRIPILGDQDNGKLLGLSINEDICWEEADPRPLLVLGGIYFQRDEWLSADPRAWQDAHWLIGPNKIAEFIPSNVPQADKSVAFSASGIYIMRGQGNYVMVDVGTNGQKGVGGHGHNDLFSYELFSHGREWIIDPGSGTYTNNYRVRNYFRSAISHNIVVVDGEEPHPFNEEILFRLPDAGKARVLKWLPGQESDILEIEHDCYHRLSDPVTYRRIIHCNYSQFELNIRDNFEAKSQHNYRSYLHLAKDITIHEVDSRRFDLISPSDKVISVRWDVHPSSSEPKLSIKPSLISPAYGYFLSSSVIWIEWEALGRTSIEMYYTIKSPQRTNV